MARKRIGDSPLIDARTAALGEAGNLAQRCRERLKEQCCACQSGTAWDRRPPHEGHISHTSNADSGTPNT